MTSRSVTGKLGEDIASKYLANKGYEIIGRNHRQKYGEIDIVALRPNGTLVLVEVKTVSGIDPQYSAEDQMTRAKIHKFKRVAQAYANNYFKNRDDSKGWRLDLISINLDGNKASVKHYENIF